MTMSPRTAVALVLAWAAAMGLHALVVTILAT
jgi:hypothetical protein